MTAADARSNARRAAAEIRASDVVAILGAGLSFESGYPMTSGLAPYVWMAFDADPPAKQTLVLAVGGDNEASAKSLIGDHPEKLATAFSLLADHPAADATFRAAFARLDAARAHEPAPAHDALAELVHRGIIEFTVSLNWDTLLERRHEQKYGRRLRPDIDPLAKPHGDAANPASHWILPGEQSELSAELVTQVRDLAEDRPRVLLIIGYSESDEAIVRELIGPLEERWRVVRIGPTAAGPLDIPLAADEALPQLLEALALRPEMPGWEYIGFSQQRSISAALAGERLDFRDVEACPRFPEADEACRFVAMTGTAVIAGGSGTGKSITGYQCAHTHAIEGWEVVRLATPDPSSEQLAAALLRLKHRTVALIDDAQSLPPGVTRRLLEAGAPDRCRVVVMTAEDPAPGTAIRMSGARAVRVMREVIAARHDEILPIVRGLDDRVGSGPRDEPLETRLATAAREETPWRFAFVLRGGWREARSVVASLRESDRADLLLAALALGQLASADAGIDRDALARCAATFAQSQVWFENAFAELRRRHLVTDVEPLRTPHARFAEIALHSVFEDRSDPRREQLFTLLRATLMEGAASPSLQGTLWILEGMRSADGLWATFGEIVDAEVLDRLLTGCRASSAGSERGVAALLLNNLRRWNPGATEAIRNEPEWIRTWVTDIDAESAGGLSRLLNDLHNDERELAEEVCAELDPRFVLSQVYGAEPSELWGWASFLDRFAVAASEAQRRQFAKSLDEPALVALVNDAYDVQTYSTAKLLAAIAEYDRSMALRLVDQQQRAIAASLNRAPIEAFDQHRDVFWWILGFGPHFLRRKGPDRAGRRVARRITRYVDPDLIAGAVSTVPRRDWGTVEELLFFLYEAGAEVYTTIVSKVDIENLDGVTKGLWHDMPFELMQLLNGLGLGVDRQPARELVSRHASEISVLNSRLVTLAPDATASRLRDGVGLNLGIESGNDWGAATSALDCLADIDRELVPLVLSKNHEALCRGLSNLRAGNATAAIFMLRLIREVTPDLVIDIAREIDVDRAYETWSACLRASSKERSALRDLVLLLDGLAEAGTELALRLANRFPTVARARDAAR